MTVPSEFRKSRGGTSGGVFPCDRIKAVAFDAVGTVMYPAPGVAEAYRRAIRRHCSVEVSEREVDSILKNELAGRSAGLDLQTSEDVEYAFWATVIHRLCPANSGFQDCFDDLFAHFGDPSHWKCFTDVGGAIQRIQNAGFACALASNFDRRLNSVCDGLPEISDVPHRIISSAVGWRKPALQFFAAISERLQLPPDEILMVGDDLTNDVRGATAAGLPAVWLCRDDSLDEQLPDNAYRFSSLTQLADELERRCD